MHSPMFVKTLGKHKYAKGFSCWLCADALTKPVSHILKDARHSVFYFFFSIPKPYSIHPNFCEGYTEYYSIVIRFGQQYGKS
jgi:hypothetical protein